MEISRPFFEDMLTKQKAVAPLSRHERRAKRLFGLLRRCCPTAALARELKWGGSLWNQTYFREHSNPTIANETKEIIREWKRTGHW